MSPIGDIGDLICESKAGRIVFFAKIFPGWYAGYVFLVVSPFRFQGDSKRNPVED
jgi:hypothetical protein